jgi:hypothetical protein
MEVVVVFSNSRRTRLVEMGVKGMTRSGLVLPVMVAPLMSCQAVPSQYFRVNAPSGEVPEVPE